MNRNTFMKLVGRISLTAIAGLALLMFCARPLCAQVDSGAILGTVADASGAAVVGANVTLTNSGTGAALSTTTGSDGSYKFSPVRIGTYKMTAAFKGFETLT
ncbi:MAG: carboxypeptidase-like regulatory domain-containing protein, partial [Candidatus Acidiferrum sp.]